MKIAVSGATGFIGRHVVAAMRRRGDTPVLVLRPGAAAGGDLAGLETVAVDFAEPEAAAVQRIAGLDGLIHLAWGGLPNYQSAHHYEQELPLHFGFLRRLVEGGLRHLTVAGTCFEYGMRCGPLSEEMAPAPDNAYAFAKDALHWQLRHLQQRHDVTLTWARLFYLYGEGQAPSSIYALLAAAAARGEATFRMSGGEQIRDYLPIHEAADHMARLAALGQNIGAVNIGSGEPASLRAMVLRWIAQNNWNITPELGYYPYVKHEPFAFWSDVRKLHRHVSDQ